MFRERADVWPQLYPMRPKEINLEKRESRSSPSFLLPSRRFAAAIPGAEVVVFPNASHMTFVEVPESYLSVVRGFVEAAPETAPHLRAQLLLDRPLGTIHTGANRDHPHRGQ